MLHGLAALGRNLAAAFAPSCDVEPVFTIGRLHAASAPQPVRERNTVLGCSCCWA